jgi:Na+/H+ antiporter NhaC
MVDLKEIFGVVFFFAILVIGVVYYVIFYRKSSEQITNGEKNQVTDNLDMKEISEKSRRDILRKDFEKSIWITLIIGGIVFLLTRAYLILLPMVVWILLNYSEYVNKVKDPQFEGYTLSSLFGIERKK